MTFKEYETELASLFSLVITRIHFTILFLFFIASRRSVDGTSREQHSRTYPGGVTSDNPEEFEVTVGRDFNDEFVSAEEISNDGSQRRETSRKVAMDTLPEDVLVKIFDSYRLDPLIRSHIGGRPWEWQMLAHVCKAWRSVLLTSSHYLGLRLFFTNGMPVREILSSWPALPIVIQYTEALGSSPLTLREQDNIIALLQLTTRLREVQLTVTTPLLEKITTFMQQPFSELEYLHLSTPPELVLPSEFGGSMARLRALRMVGTALPALPGVLLSAHDLFSLQLEELPSAGYILEALIICLPTMPQLKTLRIHFLSPTSRPVLITTDQPLQGFSVLPVLNSIEFRGTSEYLESLLSGFSAPLLENFRIDFFNQLTFDTPQLSRFIRPTETQRLPTHATIQSSVADISIALTQLGELHQLSLRISCRQLDWQIPAMAEICDRLSPTLADVEQLEISTSASFPDGQDDMDFTYSEILELFRPFRNVQRLSVTEGSLSLVAGALGLVTGELATVTLPELQEIQTERYAELDSARSSLEPFIATRWRSARPVVVGSRARRSARRPLTSTVRQVLPEHFKFRILVVGKSGSGKSSLIRGVFKVDVTAAPERALEKADINVEFRPDDNRYLIVHEYSGLDSQDSGLQDLQTIRSFISHRSDPSRSPSERLHAVWICVPASDAIAGRLGDGVEEILGLRNVPVVLVFTKFDVVVSRVLFDIAGSGAQYHERAWARAHIIYEDSCRRLFHKDPRDVPAEIVSEKSRFIDLIDNLIVTTDRFITGSRAPSAGSSVQGEEQRVGTVPLAWSAALRVNHDIVIQASIEVGRSRYWRSLWSSLDFADQAFESCVNIIHDDVIEIWNLNDKTGYLLSDGFKVKMSHLVKDLAGPANAASGSDPTRAEDDYADWVHDLYIGSQGNVRCVVGYIVDLTVILDGIFRTAAGDMSPEDALQIFERHVRSRRRDAIHRDIRSFVTEAFAIRFTVPQKDLVLERIIDLIKQFCVPS